MRQPVGFQFVAAVGRQRQHVADAEFGTQGEGHVGGGPLLADGGADHMRQSLATVGRRRGERGPARGDELLVGLLEALRGNDTCRGHPAAFEIAHAVQGIEDLRGELAGLLDDRGDVVTPQAEVGIAGQRQHLVQLAIGGKRAQEVGDGRSVWHGGDTGGMVRDTGVYPVIGPVPLRN